jgi:hypothetical protein
MARRTRRAKQDRTGFDIYAASSMGAPGTSTRSSTSSCSVGINS